MDFFDVLTFHEKFLLPCGVLPKPMTQPMIDFRVPFLYEELDEFGQAHAEKNLVQAADALLDLVYVACGTALFIGISERQRALWPQYSDVLWATKETGFIVPAKPAFMPEGVHRHFAAALRSRINLFVMSHQAAIDNELNAIEISLLNLRLLCHACHVAASLMGVPWVECWAHVQEANMAKRRAARDGSDSKRGTPWDVVKPEEWSAPDAKIAETLLHHGWLTNGLDINKRTGKVRLLNQEVE
jgi:predicted HAD superfamily Cof-like phosphohydrolase